MSQPFQRNPTALSKLSHRCQPVTCVACPLRGVSSSRSPPCNCFVFVVLLLPPTRAPCPMRMPVHTPHSPQVGLRGINGLYLFEIERADGSIIKVVDHDTVLEKGDTLWFAGEQWGPHLDTDDTPLRHACPASGGCVCCVSACFWQVCAIAGPCVPPSALDRKPGPVRCRHLTHNQPHSSLCGQLLPLPMCLTLPVYAHVS